MHQSSRGCGGHPRQIVLPESRLWLVKKVNFCSFCPATDTTTATAYRRGRWGAAASAPAEHASEPVAERLMPFLVRAAEAPSYASVALVKPEVQEAIAGPKRTVYFVYFCCWDGWKWFRSDPVLLHDFCLVDFIGHVTDHGRTVMHVNGMSTSFCLGCPFWNWLD